MAGQTTRNIRNECNAELVMFPVEEVVSLAAQNQVYPASASVQVPAFVNFVDIKQGAEVVIHGVDPPKVAPKAKAKQTWRHNLKKGGKSVSLSEKWKEPVG